MGAGGRQREAAVGTVTLLQTRKSCPPFSTRKPEEAAGWGQSSPPQVPLSSRTPAQL